MSRRRDRHFVFWAERIINGQTFGVERNSPLWWALADEPPGTVITLDDGYDYRRLIKEELS